MLSVCRYCLTPMGIFTPLTGFCRALKLSPPQQIAVGLGLSRSPNPGVAKEGVKFLVARVPGLVGGGGGQLSLEALHSLLELVNSSEEVTAQVCDMQLLCDEFPVFFLFFFRACLSICLLRVY